MELSKVFLSKFLALILLKILSTLRKERKPSLLKRWSVWSPGARRPWRVRFHHVWERTSPRGWNRGSLWRRVLMPGWDTVTGKCFQSRRQDLCQTTNCLWKCLCPARVAAGPSEGVFLSFPTVSDSFWFVGPLILMKWLITGVFT